MAVELARGRASTIQVRQRIRRPHPIIAGWLAELEERKRRVQTEHDPWVRNLIKPVGFSQLERRRHRILDALFKGLERQGALIAQSGPRKLLAEILGQQIQFELREVRRQTRTPLTDEERGRASNKDRLTQDFRPTGLLLFRIKTHVDPALRREWLERPGAAMEDFLSDIVGTMMTAGSFLAERQRAVDAARSRAMKERRQEEKRRSQKRNDVRGRRLIEIAQNWREVAVAREFVAALRRLDLPEDQVVEGMPIREWILWAEEHLDTVDPMNGGVAAIFEDIGKIGSQSYDDN